LDEHAVLPGRYRNAPFEGAIVSAVAGAAGSRRRRRYFDDIQHQRLLRHYPDAVLGRDLNLMDTGIALRRSPLDGKRSRREALCVQITELQVRGKARHGKVHPLSLGGTAWGSRVL